METNYARLQPSRKLFIYIRLYYSFDDSTPFSFPCVEDSVQHFREGRLQDFRQFLEGTSISLRLELSMSLQLKLSISLQLKFYTSMHLKIYISLYLKLEVVGTVDNRPSTK